MVDSKPQVGDWWIPKENCPLYTSPAFLVLEVTRLNAKVFWFGANVWAWYGFSTIQQLYDLMSRVEND